jgi:hypothetical protein
MIAALFVAFVGSAQAQLQTYETVSTWEGSGFTFSASGTNATRGQVFSDVSAVKSMTYNFFTSGVASATSLTATFGEWNTGSNAFVSGTTVSFGTISIPASTSGSWVPLATAYGVENEVSTFAYNFDLATLSGALINETFGYLTDSSKSYALMLTNVTGSNTNLSLGLSNDDVFAFGFAKGFSDNDWAFAQIIVAPGNQTLVPIPESGTIAAFATGLLVLGMVGYRVRQRRTAVAAPVAITA